MNKKKKLIIALVFTLGFVATGSAQSDKLMKKVTEKVEKLNQQIVDGEGEAISAEQRGKITVFEIERIKKIRKVKKSGVEDDDLKEARKEINKVKTNN
ncbi:hypothetical protein [Christiangramia forsetii]|uniref:Secreted protein n=2 Tax=Christiangramia forsetii TaxID=411153 RepID=A0M0F9_CHRFK|nr:hypothetical protein [Christiangramia forsetii]GGG40978.1 hypothetical protein GCM10011532_25900 [Christiangramia forsetii]CAL66104.1 secreted protein [Christiangramia forsetii KT0803]